MVQGPFLVGLCAVCRHKQVVRSSRHSIFVMCRLAKDDPRFSKYPVLPVLRCAGFKREDSIPEEPEA
jgi:ssDNA-binding Zn-finger/Zn-ribbon topoisomerase 1